MYKHSVKSGVFPMPVFLPTMEGWLTQEDHKFKASRSGLGSHRLKTSIKKRGGWRQVVDGSVCEDTDTKPDSLSLIPRTHVVQENQLLATSCPITSVQAYMCTHTHTNKI